MQLEHLALQVSDPINMANWYVQHLGFSVVRSGGGPVHARFMLEHSGSVMLEIYHNRSVPVPDYQAMNPLLLHLAFVSADPIADRDRLVSSGAQVVEDLNVAPTGDQFVMLRDPWGVPLQLVKRAQPML